MYLPVSVMSEVYKLSKFLIKSFKCSGMSLMFRLSFNLAFLDLKYSRIASI